MLLQVLKGSIPYQITIKSLIKQAKMMLLELDLIQAIGAPSRSGSPEGGLATPQLRHGSGTTTSYWCMVT